MQSVLQALEDVRSIEEDLERIEQAITDLQHQEPKHIRNRLNQEHAVAQLLEQYKQQCQNLVRLLENSDEPRRGLVELDAADPFAEFYKGLDQINEHYARYPNAQAENPEHRYKPKPQADGTLAVPSIVDTMFSDDEAFGRFFDLHLCHNTFNNLPGVKRLSYMPYLEDFDDFTAGHGGLKRAEKLNDEYFKYLLELEEYLTSFRKRTRPLEDNDEIIAGFTREFEEAWDKDDIEGWKLEAPTATDGQDLTGEDVTWCEDCEKEFANSKTYRGHLTGRKHKKASELRKQRQEEDAEDAAHSAPGKPRLSARRIKEKAIAGREWRIKKLVASMSTERSDTRVNAERRQGMTEREREQERENLQNIAEAPQMAADEGDEDGEDGEEKIYNPLKLPLAWDGKPIPYWLYRLHGLGVEFHCEICGNFVYMGRRAFDKHFGEPRHIYGLKCLGITNVTLFRDITKIEEATKLWEKIQQEQKKSKVDEGSIVQMEDGEGNVMPEKVYLDLQKQGLL